MVCGIVVSFPKGGRMLMYVLKLVCIMREWIRMILDIKIRFVFLILAGMYFRFGIIENSNTFCHLKESKFHVTNLDRSLVLELLERLFQIKIHIGRFRHLSCCDAAWFNQRGVFRFVDSLSKDFKMVCFLSSGFTR